MPVCRLGNTDLAACELSVTGVIRRFKRSLRCLGITEAGRDKGMSILSVGTDKDLMFFGPDNEALSRDECDFLRVIEFFQAEAPKNASRA